MFKGKKILGVITARGGSKGIPRKNIKDLAGKPLIAYTIEAAKESKFLTRTIISTEDNEIADISKKYGGDVPFMRPAKLAGDTSTSIDAVQHTITALNERGEEYDYIMILQPTSPLRISEDIDACIKKIIDTGADSVMSVMELDDFSIKKLKVIEDDIIKPLAEDEGMVSSRRQDMVKVYKRNTAIYLTKTSFIIKGDLFGKISRPYLMSAERSIDINRMIDFEIAEFFLTKKA
jgi:CMP-N,N'-diacetyllegionaminic acid synthase